MSKTWSSLTPEYPKCADRVLKNILGIGSDIGYSLVPAQDNSYPFWRYRTRTVLRETKRSRSWASTTRSWLSTRPFLGILPVTLTPSHWDSLKHSGLTMTIRCTISLNSLKKNYESLTSGRPFFRYVAYSSLPEWKYQLKHSNCHIVTINWKDCH